ncbi:MAG: hypothetical protein DRQ57_01900 [Gammaproteobacteria bacterium]|nr:MAG: hypothetical protein DRQ57_01900 [Gammaproteobacteria bacterium]
MKISKYFYIISINILLTIVLFIIVDLCSNLFHDVKISYILEKIEIRQNYLISLEKQSGKVNKIFSGIALHPYFGWINVPNKKFNEIDTVLNRIDPYHNTYSTNNWGFPSSFDYPYIRQPDDFLVFILGGSVAAYFGIVEGSHFVKKLKEIGIKKSIKLINLASFGYKQPQQLNVFLHAIVSGMKPDLVINIDGFNEIGLGYSNKVHYSMNPVYPSGHHWFSNIFELSNELGSRKDIVKLLANKYSLNEMELRLYKYLTKFSGSNIVRIVLLTIYDYMKVQEAKIEESISIKASSSSNITKNFYSSVYQSDTNFHSSCEYLVSIWRNSVNLIDNVCDKMGCFFVEVAQPTFSYKYSKDVLTANEKSSFSHGTWDQGIKSCYGILEKDIGIMKTKGLNTLNLIRVFKSINSDIFVDQVHFNKKGYDIFSNKIIDYLSLRIDHIKNTK